MYETNEKTEKLVVKNAKFITSAASEKQFISTDKPMIAVCGKSNVGKSSFINMLANRKRLAKTSSAPGRTRLVNYFDFGEFVLADLPGYGFAKVSKSEKERWAKTLDLFFKNKQTNAGRQPSRSYGGRRADDKVSQSPYHSFYRRFDQGG